MDVGVVVMRTRKRHGESIADSGPRAIRGFGGCGVMRDQ
jgi:hypothetical protein